MAALLCFALLFISALSQAAVSLDYEFVSSMLDHLPEKPDDSRIYLDSMEIQDVFRRIPGSPWNVSLHDPKITKLAWKSIDYYESKEAFDHRYKIVQILSATRQVVSGLLTKINFEAIATECTKNDRKNTAFCPTLFGAKVIVCSSSVWEQLWLENGTKITINCDVSNWTQKYFEIKRDGLLNALSKDEKLFKEFLKKHNRKYVNDPEEYMQRFRIFRENLGFIDELNEKELGTAKYGVNEFADMSKREFKSRYLGISSELDHKNWMLVQKAVIPDVDIPDAFDWREKGAVTPVKNQGLCVSGWAFSVTGNIEGQYKIKHGKLLSLSEQQLIDCDKLNAACEGGHPDNAYKSIKDIGGLELESDYPYEGNSSKCRFKSSLAKVQVTDFIRISKSEIDMQKWLVQNGPITIRFNSYALQYYTNGVIQTPNGLCYKFCLDAVALIVGYGIDKDPKLGKSAPYWIIKNSWGSKWGENGYFRMFRGDETCGVNQRASSAIV